MDLNECYRIYSNYLNAGVYTDEDDLFLFTEAAQLLYEHTGDVQFIRELGGVYYGRKEFDLARKYYEIAAEKGDHYANIGLGYIWYYGRTGERDYKKAFEYFSRCPGDINAEYKIADMYRTGKYVEKDEARYEAKIEEIYGLMQEGGGKWYIPEIYSRLARIRIKQGRREEAYTLLCQTRKPLVRRILDNGFFGDFTIMKGVIEDLHSLDIYHQRHRCYDIFDLYVLFKKPGEVKIMSCDYLSDVDYDEDEPETIMAMEEDGAVVVEHRGRWYRSVDDFIRENITELCGYDGEPPRIAVCGGAGNE